ncbi:MAG: stage V sporulation protein AC [Firmicutes bacterium]|nr:stage V sporulation protein AC [Bacillota bacterium]
MANKSQQQAYQQLAKKHIPKPDYLGNSLRAFLVGGAISALGQGVTNFYLSTGMAESEAGAYTAITMIFLGALLTGLGIYDNLAKIGGAGSALPITGFANTIVSAAMDFKSEGYVLGMAAQMYKIAGPVITYGVTSAILAGLVKWLLWG